MAGQMGGQNGGWMGGRWIDMTNELIYGGQKGE